MVESMVAHSLTWWAPVGYLIVFIGMIFEGDLLLFTAGFLTHREFFDPLLILLVIFGGVCLGDALWFWLGKNMGTRLPRLMKWVERATRPFDDHLVNRPRRTILLSKFTYGLNHAMIVRAGNLGTSWHEFLKDDIVASFLWIVIVGGAGFLSSASYGAFRQYLKSIELAFLLGILIFFAVWHFVTFISRRNL